VRTRSAPVFVGGIATFDQFGRTSVFALACAATALDKSSRAILHFHLFPRCSRPANDIKNSRPSWLDISIYSPVSVRPFHGFFRWVL